MQLIVHKQARHDYAIQETLQAGMVLLGHEVKSLRGKHGSLAGSFVRVVGGEAFLLNAQVSPYPYADTKEYDPKRSRKLLLKKKEIRQLAEASQRKGWSLVPLSIEVEGRNIKLTIGLGQGKKQFEKRAELKKRAVQRDVEKEMKQKTRLVF